MKYFVEELPRGCFYCDCSHTEDYDPRYKIDGNKICGIEDLEVNDYNDYENPQRPEWCPLRELPKKLISEYSDAGNSYRNGWNAYLDEILEMEG